MLLLPLSGAPSASAGQPRADRLQRAFTEAAARFHVPRSVLLGVSYLESRWDGHGGAPSVSGGYGPMHLTDARTALTRAPEFSQGHEDARGDSSRGRKPVPHGAAQRTVLPAELPARLRTLGTAARLTGLPAGKLRTDPAANVLGGAALLAAEQRKLGLAASGDPARWYAAVARYGGQDSALGGRAFADEVYDVMRRGQTRTTDAGQRVTLAAAPGLTPDATQQKRLGTPATKAAAPSGDSGLECPWNVACESVPAPYEEFGDNDYGNHDKAERPRDQKVNVIVIHDTEGSWDVTLKLIKDPKYVSWNYTIRSSDGLIAQHVPTKDVAWHAGNWYINSHSIGIEHEGFLAAPDAWYTEAMYRASARLVKYLSRKYDVPLDRQHILGHDNVPGTTASTIPGMHTDPGPYWDWAHYFTLLGKPFHSTGAATAGWSPSALTTTATSRPTPAVTRPGTPARRTVPRRSGCTPRPARAPRWSGTSGCTRTAVTRRRGERHRRPGHDGPAVRGGGPVRRLDGDLVPRAEGVVPQPARRADRGERRGADRHPEGRP